MHVNDIRKMKIEGGPSAPYEIAQMLREIAAQLAELNTTLDVLVIPIDKDRKEINVFMNGGQVETRTE